MGTPVSAADPEEVPCPAAVWGQEGGPHMAHGTRMGPRLLPAGPRGSVAPPPAV